jgi:hypothetical protein
VRSLFLVAFVVALGQALRAPPGSQPGPATYAWLALALCAAAAAALLRRQPILDESWSAAPIALAVAALVVQASQIVSNLPAWRTRPAAHVLGVVSLAAIAAAVVAVGALAGGSRLSRLAPPLICGALGASFLYVVYATPDPWMDVHFFHVESFRDLLAGRSPYGQQRANIYAGRFSFYAPEVLTDGGKRVNVGFPYPPLQLLLSLPAHLIAGDYRYGQAAALPISAALMMCATRTRSALAAGVLFLTTPMIFYFVEGSWTEPLVVLLLSATLFCAVRAPRWLPLALGGLFAIKQYTLALAPLVALLLPENGRSARAAANLLFRALAVAALVTLPFFAWNPRGFVNDLVLFQIRQPLRLDSLSWLPLARLAGWPLPAWSCFALLGLVVAAAALWSPRTPAGFAAAAALGYCAFFATAKQAFANYYLFPLAAGAWAMALAEPRAQTVNQGT